MLLADMGAEVIRVERAQAVRGPAPAEPPKDVSLRSRRNIALDLKHPDGVATLLDLVEQADALIEGFRPGVMERLGVGPDECLARNPQARVRPDDRAGARTARTPMRPATTSTTSRSPARWPTSAAPGEAPVPPLNLVGDFGGGGMFLAFGVVCGLLEAQKSGAGPGRRRGDGRRHGDADVDVLGDVADRRVRRADNRGTNLLDTGAHFYDAYECADGEYISLGSIEPQFYAELLRLTGLTDDPQFAKQMDKAQWPAPEGPHRRGVQDARPATSGARSWSTPTCASPRC